MQSIEIGDLQVILHGVVNLGQQVEIESETMANAGDEYVTNPWIYMVLYTDLEVKRQF